jgi:hypothetical protein
MVIGRPEKVEKAPKRFISRHQRTKLKQSASLSKAVEPLWCMTMSEPMPCFVVLCVF